ncbi:MAG TPA: transcriptional repressor LexA [Candidatus Limnocylindria bacterium]|nr:transcriptional repressor LexA [Candidatus Limnocylindria bacterium]
MLNDRARAILDFIRRFTRDHGFPPTIREIGEAFEISSTNGVRYYLNLLEKSGHLKRTGKLSRGMIAVSLYPERAGIPILGRVAAGQPILAEESYDGNLEAGQLFGNPEGLFALKIRGDSMIEAGILEGDYVIVRHQNRANAGEIVVGLLGDEATVKYYQPRGDGIELVAANSKYQPILVGEDSEFSILGVVRGVIRTVGR